MLAKVDNPKTEIVAIRIDEKTANKINAVIKQFNLSKPDLLRQSLIDYLETNFIFN